MLPNILRNIKSNLFKPVPEGLSKVDYWKKWEYFELLDNLHEAEQLLSYFRGGHSHDFKSAQDFHQALVDVFDYVEYGNQNDLTRFCNWFAPTADWDDFVGMEGIALGNRIYERVSRWKRSNL